jgi:hypothetical protein
MEELSLQCCEGENRFQFLTKREMVEMIYGRASESYLREYELVRGSMVMGLRSNRARLMRMLAELHDETKAATRLHPHYQMVDGGTSIYALPGDALFAIFFELENFEQFAYLRRVCTAWHRLIKQNNCWDHYLRDIYAIYSPKTLRGLLNCQVQPVPYRAFFYKQLKQWGVEIESTSSNKLARQLCGCIKSTDTKGVRVLLQRGAKACDWAGPQPTQLDYHYSSYDYSNASQPSPLRTLLVSLEPVIVPKDNIDQAKREGLLVILELLVNFGAKASKKAPYHQRFVQMSDKLKKLIPTRTFEAYD